MGYAANVIGFGAVALALASCGVNADAKRGQELVSTQLRDPSSAEFKSVQTKQIAADLDGPGLTNGGVAVCGEVNAKNAYGGYVGFTPFVVDLESEQVFMQPSDDAALEVMFRTIRSAAGCQ